jgi:hypothetical protein
MPLKFFPQMTMSHPVVETSREHELVAIAAELERYWSDQWRRAKEICDLLEERLAHKTPARPRLQLVAPDDVSADESDDAPPRPPLRLVDA